MHAISIACEHVCKRVGRLRQCVRKSSVCMINMMHMWCSALTFLATVLAALVLGVVVFHGQVNAVS